MTFGKPGRPPEDRLARQYEIYTAVVPLMERDGARRLSMRDAAHAACLSIGGLYHYFPTKRDLLLHGLQEDARGRLCHVYRTKLITLAAWSLEQYIATYLDFAIEMLTFIRPSVQAALELGNEEFQSILDQGFTYHVVELQESLRVLLPDLDTADLEALARAVRRTCLGTCVDRHAAPDDVRDQLRALVEGYALRGVRAAVA